MTVIMVMIHMLTTTHTRMNRLRHTKQPHRLAQPIIDYKNSVN
jgi:hypothetical protein